MGDLDEVAKQISIVSGDKQSLQYETHKLYNRCWSLAANETSKDDIKVRRTSSLVSLSYPKLPKLCCFLGQMCDVCGTLVDICPRLLPLLT